MAPQRKLENVVKSEKKYLSFKPTHWVFKCADMSTVPLGNGQFGTIKSDRVMYEMGGERNQGSIGRLLDPKVPEDKLILDLAEQTLKDKPWLATHEDYKLQILGEYSTGLPWNGYDEQTPEQIASYFESLPEAVRPKLEDVMKYELNKVRFDEDEDCEVSATDEEKVKVLNELYKVHAKAEAATSTDTVDLA